MTATRYSSLRGVTVNAPDELACEFTLTLCLPGDELRIIDDRRPSNPIVITGDLHCSWVSDLKAYYPDEDSDTVCTEFVGTSITSGLGDYYEEAYRGHLDQNPHVRFFDERNGGYVRCDVTQE